MHMHEERFRVMIIGYVWLFVYSIFPQANFLACTSLTHSLMFLTIYLNTAIVFITYTSECLNHIYSCQEINYVL